MKLYVICKYVCQLGTRNDTGKALNATITGNALNATITGNALNATITSNALIARITSNALIARITGDALNATITGTGNGLDDQQINELTFSSKIYRLLHTVLGSENKVYGLLVPVLFKYIQSQKEESTNQLPFSISYYSPTVHGLK